MFKEKYGFDLTVKFLLCRHSLLFYMFQRIMWNSKWEGFEIPFIKLRDALR